MKISVIIPVYNCANYVKRCVHSIMSQTHTDLEIICVDDGSSDDSGRVLDELMQKDSRIRVIHQENAGVSAARNAGIEIATGEWITFVDADDAVEFDMYEVLLSQVLDEDIDIVHCGYKRIQPDGNIKEVNGTGKLVKQDSYGAAKCLLQGTLFVGSLCNKLYKTSLFKNVRLDTTLAINEDVLANAELFSLANTVVFFDVGKYLMYERIGSATSGTKQIKVLTDCVNAAEKIFEIYRNTPIESVAAERLCSMLIQLYRWYVRFAMKDSYEIRKNLEKRIRDVSMMCQNISFREYLNYFLMRYVPNIYKGIYMVYDKVRIPNWDVNTL